MCGCEWYHPTTRITRFSDADSFCTHTTMNTHLLTCIMFALGLSSPHLYTHSVVHLPILCCESLLDSLHAGQYSGIKGNEYIPHNKGMPLPAGDPISATYRYFYWYSTNERWKCRKIELKQPKVCV